MVHYGQKLPVVDTFPLPYQRPAESGGGSRLETAGLLASRRNREFIARQVITMATWASYLEREAPIATIALYQREHI